MATVTSHLHMLCEGCPSPTKPPCEWQEQCSQSRLEAMPKCACGEVLLPGEAKQGLACAECRRRAVG